MESPVFSLVMPTVRQTDMVRECFESLFEHEPDRSRYEIIVVDDGSEPEVQAWLQNYCDANSIRLLLKEKNSGFSHTVNTGMAVASGRYIVLVNNDIKFIAPFLSNVEAAFKRDDKVGIVGAKLLYPDMRVQHAGVVRLPSHRDFIHINKMAHRDMPMVNISRYFISVTGALYGIRRETYQELGGFNEKYFLSCEDTEYSLRAWTAGWRVYYAHDVEAIHLEGGTRGNTHASKMQKGRDWFLREMETRSKFLSDVNRFKCKEFELDINRLNTQMMIRVTPAPAVVTVDKQVPRILVKRKGALGDVLLTTPIVRRLREEYGPEAVIHVGTDCGAAYINNPHVTGVVASSTPGGSYSRFVDLDLVYERRPDLHILDAYHEHAFGKAEGDRSTVLVPAASDHEIVRSQFILNYKIDVPNAVLMHMGVTWRNRTYPKEQWMEVVANLNVKGIQVVLVGAGADFTLGHSPGVVDLTRRLTIHQIAALMSRARAFICNDSALLHVAGTTNIPIVSIFTSTLPELRQPWRHGEYGWRFEAVQPNLDCRGCLHREAPPVVFCDCTRQDTKYKCLQEVKPQSVVEATLRALGG